MQLDALEYLHAQGYVHTDIKASNLLTGFKNKYEVMCIEICRNETNICGRGCYVVLQVYLVDYGLAARYTCDGQHRVYKVDPRKAHDGTLEFTSHDAHNGAGISIIIVGMMIVLNNDHRSN